MHAGNIAQSVMPIFFSLSLSHSITCMAAWALPTMPTLYNFFLLPFHRMINITRTFTRIVYSLDVNNNFIHGGLGFG